MKTFLHTVIFTMLFACNSTLTTDENVSDNPFFTALNEPIDYANVTADHIKEYSDITISNVVQAIARIQQVETLTFVNTFVAMDDIVNEITKANNNCFLHYWVSPDSLSRVVGLASYQDLDSLANIIFADKTLFDNMITFSRSDEYNELSGPRKILVDEMIQAFEQSGVNLDSSKLVMFKKLTADINKLTSDYSTNMNSANELLKLDEKGAEGLPKNFKETYAVGEFAYEIPAIPATRRPVMNNAVNEETRKAFMMMYSNRAADKNLDILDELVQKRYEKGQLMGYDSYAGYNLKPKMASKPETVWNFINDLIDRSKEKAKVDHEVLKKFRNQDQNIESSNPMNPWDLAYYRNQILKTEYQVDHEKIREYLPMDRCLSGMFDIYQQLLGLQFRKVENPSVWHEEVEMYEVFEGETLRGRFYLDLYPRPNKESWFYGVGLTDGKATDQGYEVPVKMLLGNFPRPTETLPSLLSHNELSILFHEFGHIMDGMSYQGEFMFQSGSKSDFVEAMSQIFENWIWDYDMLSSLTEHYKTGEVLPKETFDNMLAAKNVSSGLAAIRSLRSCTYDMMLYDQYDPENRISTDDLWRTIDKDLGVLPTYVEGTHPQASWIHINTHPVYYYGYLWSEVYAQDMFTEFEKNGLLDQETGIRYRKLILANGSQRDILEAVEEFLGRPSNNEAYIKSLGLN